MNPWLHDHRIDKMQDTFRSSRGDLFYGSIGIYYLRGYRYVMSEHVKGNRYATGLQNCYECRN